nr:LIM domain and actin-binding protein 1 isoform X3 [Leptinotarsa decemlineata]
MTFDTGAQPLDTTNCKACSKQVFQMEQIKAEKAIWHKNCFRCTECSKQLTVETYVSHEGNLYCKPHFKSLFAPKAVEEESPPRPRKPELIIRENQPLELPPDVVRASDKPDLGLEELQSLNVKERFQVFEQYQTETQETDRGTATVNVKRSPSILSKLAKFQQKGMDIGVSDDSLNGIPVEGSDTEEEAEEDVPEGEDPTLYKAKRVQKEKPFHFTNLSEVKNKWEHGEQNSRDERREERKQEIQSIRNKLFMGKQGKMKEAYQQAVMQSESCANLIKSEKIESYDTKSLKERFEKGETFNEKETKGDDEEDTEVFQSEISKKSRSLFLELDANASKAPQMSNVTIPKQNVKTARETDTPEREIYHDPEVVRAEDTIDDSIIAKKTHTTSKMLNKFRQMEEENLTKEQEPLSPKPMKSFTPPPELPRTENESADEQDSGSEEESEGQDQMDNQNLPEDLLEARRAARATQLRAKFEKWEQQEIRREESQAVNIGEEGGDESQIESTRSLRARFESMRDTSSDSSKTQRVKVNRFVEIPSITVLCESCDGKVYPLEKISVHGHVYHKNCFKCMECSCVLRMDSYSYNQGLLYCTPHFKRLFISKGNYDTAFGLGQHKEKWNCNATMA